MAGDEQTKPKRIPLSATTSTLQGQNWKRLRTKNGLGNSLYRDAGRASQSSPRNILQAHSRTEKPSTRDSGARHSRLLETHLGGVRLDKITAVMVKAYREKRLAQGVNRGP